MGQARDAELGAFLEANLKEQSSALFSLNPRCRRGGRAADVAEVLALAIDLDGPSLEQGPKVARLATYVPIFALVWSGSADHLHLYLRLATRESRLDLVEMIHRRLERYLGTDPTNALSHCWRLPDSLNWKTGTPVRTCVLACPTAQTTIEDIDRAMDVIGVPKVEPQPNGATISLLPVGPVDQDHLSALWKSLPLWAQDLIQHGKQPGDRYPSRSEADAAAILALADAGATDAEIQFIFARAPIGEKYRERGDAYLTRTIAFARSSATDSYVSVLGIRPGLIVGGRVVFELQVSSGPHLGTRFSHGIGSTSAAWPWLFRSGGLAPAALGASHAAWQLVGRTLRVRIEEIEWENKKRLEVKRWLLPLPPAAPSRSGGILHAT